MKVFFGVIGGVILLAVFTAFLYYEYRRAFDPGPEAIEYGKRGAAQIIDGDTLDLKGVPIRLAGIDACELDQVAKMGAESWPCGTLAKERLADLTAGADVRCIWSELDQYDRALAICDIYGTALVLNEILVQEGLAIAYRGSGVGAVLDPSYEAIEAQAKQNRRGLWKTEFEVPSERRRKTSPQRP